MPFWRTMRLNPVCILICFFLLSSQSIVAQTSVRFVGDSIPDSYSIYPYRIFLNSDTVLLNNEQLQRNTDYQFENNRGQFDLTTLRVSSIDTLTIIYHLIPDWMNVRYGHLIPSTGKTMIDRRIYADDNSTPSYRQEGSTMHFSGAKTFRFSSRSQGNSEFGQTLDLTLSGQLTPGLTLTGAISDRGYDPTYGVANSRLSELEKVQLTLSSKRFHARLGDFTSGRVVRQTINRKRVSGAEFSLAGGNYLIGGLIARPKGSYAKSEITGVDQKQGPYQITATGDPIVPGSEVVWINGVRMERGGNKDYVLDYPVGRITFTEKHPIDARDRIEIDYELQVTSFRGELFSGSSSVFTSDSNVTLALGWYREGDDQNQPLVGELSSSDVDLLARVGDSIGQAKVSAVVPDSMGSYCLVVDSLPDSVFVYVGDGLGDYSIGFRFIGTGKGRYRFLGGGVYQYVGNDSGDYLPERLIAVPERIDEYYARIGLKNSLLGEVKVELNQSVFDRNLLSSLNDDDNNGGFYRATFRHALGESSDGGYVVLSGRFRQKEYRSRSRINRPDFGRSFFLPSGFSLAFDELLYKADLSIPLPFSVIVSPIFEKLSYSNALSSVRSKLTLDVPVRSDMELQVKGYIVQTRIDSSQVDKEGHQNNVTAILKWKVTRQAGAVFSFESDRRVHDYDGTEKGTRYKQLRTELNSPTEQFVVEHYIEDSLISDWSQSLKRTRLTIQSSRKRGRFAYTSSLSEQWLSSVVGKDKSFMGRLTWSFRKPSARFSISSSYHLSQENRNSRGVTYLKVNTGEGDYIFVDSQYVPDIDGDYIQVDELLSGLQSVDRGSKTFLFSKTWNEVSVSFSSQIEEELLEEGKRKMSWVLPFWSDQSQEYLFFNRSYQSEVRFWPIATSYAINVRLRENREARKVANIDRVRTSRVATLILRQAPHMFRVEQLFEMFSTDRDSYYTGGGVIDGVLVSGSLRRLIGESDISLQLGYRHASSSDNEVSNQISVTVEGRFALVQQGVLQPKLELYRQSLTSIDNTTSFLLTDNRPGERGAIWSISARISLKKRMRLNMTLSGRHSDNRTGRIVGRGEMVATF